MKSRLVHELKLVAIVTLFFIVWFGILIALKELTLAEYQIKFAGISVAIIGALVTAKVVLVLDHISLGSFVSSLPPIGQVLIRTLFYTLGVAIVLILEKAFETRHSYDGFAGAMQNVLSHPDMNHVWATTISVGIGVSIYNFYSMLHAKLGGEKLKEILLKADQGGR